MAGVAGVAGGGGQRGGWPGVARGRAPLVVGVAVAAYLTLRALDNAIIGSGMNFFSGQRGRTAPCRAARPEPRSIFYGIT